MMGIETIRAMNSEAARKARAKRIKPITLTQKMIDDFKGWQLWIGEPRPPMPFKIPSIGDDRPKGYELLEELFVDSSGFGQEGEPALTQQQFAEKLVAGKAYAVTSVGQFQVYVGVFEPPKKKDKP